MKQVVVSSTFKGAAETAARHSKHSTPDQSQKKQQDNRADEGVDDCGNDAAADYDAKPRQGACV
jgi:hypothetical protein